MNVPRRIAISQSNYIPWRGYFDFIRSVDEFVLYDDMQYTRRDWRNRNKIKTPHGTTWLSIPVEVKGKYLQKIKDTRIADREWASVHWKTIQHSYARAPFFSEMRALLEPAYHKAGETPWLSEVNHLLLSTVCNILGIQTRFTWSMDYRLEEERNQRLISICQQAGATIYYTGPSARAYMDEAAFQDAGIQVVYMDYSGYPEYPQLYPPFDPAVSVLDLLFTVGHAAPTFLNRVLHAA